MKTFFVRKTPKGHGTRETLAGLGEGESLKGARVMVLDDVATSGGSILKAADVVRESGGAVEFGLVLLDREEGAEAFLATTPMPPPNPFFFYVVAASTTITLHV